MNFLPCVTLKPITRIHGIRLGVAHVALLMQSSVFVSICVSVCWITSGSFPAMRHSWTRSGLAGQYSYREWERCRKQRGRESSFYYSPQISDKKAFGTGRCLTRKWGRESQQNMTNLDDNGERGERGIFYYLLWGSLREETIKTKWQHCWVLMMSQAVRAAVMVATWLINLLFDCE